MSTQARHRQPALFEIAPPPSAPPRALPGDRFGGPALEACGRKAHRHRRGDVVSVVPSPGEVVPGIVLTEGLDVHRRHVGWVGMPGRAALWRVLCTLPDGDVDAFRATEAAAQAAGIVVQVPAFSDLASHR